MRRAAGLSPFRSGHDPLGFANIGVSEAAGHPDTIEPVSIMRMLGFLARPGGEAEPALTRGC